MSTVSTLSTSIAMFRKERQLTQEELAEAVGVTRQTIIAIEKGNYTPSVILALKLSSFFKVAVEEIFHYA